LGSVLWEWGSRAENRRAVWSWGGIRGKRAHARLDIRSTYREKEESREQKRSNQSRRDRARAFARSREMSCVVASREEGKKCIFYAKGLVDGEFAGDGVP